MSVLTTQQLPLDLQQAMTGQALSAGQLLIQQGEPAQFIEPRGKRETQWLQP